MDLLLWVLGIAGGIILLGIAFIFTIISIGVAAHYRNRRDYDND